MTRIELLPTLLGRPVYSVSAYLLGGTLIDTGCPKTAGELAAWCEDAGVERIVHTHHHEDHTGGDRLLVQRLGLEVLAPPRTAAILGNFYRLPIYRRLVWGQPGSVRARAMAGTVEIDGRPFRVVSTPGHAADHVCLHDPESGWMFTGDLYISPRVLYLRRVENAWKQLESLRRVLELEPRVVICSHAGVVEDATAALRARIAHWEGIAERAEALRADGMTLGAITREILGPEGWMTWISLGEFSKRNLVRSLLAGGPRDPCATVVGGGHDAKV